LCFQKGYNWNDLHWSKKRGSFIVKNTYKNGILEPSYWVNDPLYRIDKEDVIRTKWEVIETPLTFTENNFKNWL